METIIMGPEGRLEIPLEVWGKIGVRPGDIAEFTLTEEGFLEIKKFQGDLNDQLGSVTVDGT